MCWWCCVDDVVVDDVVMMLCRWWCIDGVLLMMLCGWWCVDGVLLMVMCCWCVVDGVVLMVCCWWWCVDDVVLMMLLLMMLWWCCVDGDVLMVCCWWCCVDGDVLMVCCWWWCVDDVVVEVEAAGGGGGRRRDAAMWSSMDVHKVIRIECHIHSATLSAILRGVCLLVAFRSWAKISTTPIAKGPRARLQDQVFIATSRKKCLIYWDTHVCECVCPYIHTYIPTYLHTYLPTYLHTYIHPSMHVCMYVCMYVCIYIYIHVYVYKYIYTYIYIYVYIYIHMYIYIYCIYIYIYCTYVYIYMYICIHTYVYIYILHIYIYTYIAYIYICMYICIYICIWSSINGSTRNGWHIGENPLKMDNLEVPHFRKPPYTCTYTYIYCRYTVEVLYVTSNKIRNNYVPRISQVIFPKDKDLSATLSNCRSEVPTKLLRGILQGHGMQLHHFHHETWLVRSRFPELLRPSKANTSPTPNVVAQNPSKSLVCTATHSKPGFPIAGLDVPERNCDAPPTAQPLLPRRLLGTKPKKAAAISRFLADVAILLHLEILNFWSITVACLRNLLDKNLSKGIESDRPCIAFPWNYPLVN